MFNFFEQPWTMLGIAIIVLFVILTYRSVVPEKRRWWQLFIPLLIAAAAFGTDALVKTDPERIEAAIDTGIKAVEREDFSTAESCISRNYRDSLHGSKEQLIAHVQNELHSNAVEKAKRTNLKIDVSGNKAKAFLFMSIKLNENSSISKSYGIPKFKIKLDVSFVKQSDKWLINGVEIRSVNQQQVRWSQVR
jgi:hypothetical protein